MMRDVFWCVMREWGRRKGRTAANVAGYILAVGLMVILSHLVLHARNVKNTVLNNLGTHFLAYLPLNAPGSDGFSRVASSTDPANEIFHSDPAQTKLFSLKKAEEVNALPTVLSAAPFLMFRMKSPEDGHLFTIGGFDPVNTVALAGNSIQETDMIQGSFIRPGDRGVVILEEAYAASFNLKFGRTITIGNMLFPIIGIARPGIRPAKADIYMTFADAEMLINRRLTVPLASEANILLVEVRSARFQDQAKRDVEKVLPGCMIDSYDCYVPSSKVMGMNEGTALWLMILAMCGAILYALHSQLSSVIERRHDIGILKAIGWTNGVVFQQLITESVLQAFVGGALGTAAGMLVLSVIPPDLIPGTAGRISLSLELPVAALGLAMIGGLIAGLFPATRAAWDSPADSLREI